MSELNKRIDNRIEELRSLNFKNRYVVGYDEGVSNSNGAYVVFDRGFNTIRYATKKKWKVRLGLFIAKLLGWKIMKE